jgi:hypothetical protein
VESIEERTLLSAVLVDGPLGVVDPNDGVNLGEAITQAGQAKTRHQLCRRFDLATIGFWLGGLALGTGGCIFGACMPYRHPVAVTISVLWWGIYFGWFGAGVGALLVLCAERPPAFPPQVLDALLEDTAAATNSPSGPASPAFSEW